MCIVQHKNIKYKYYVGIYYVNYAIAEFLDIFKFSIDTDLNS